MSYFNLLEELSNNGLNKFTVNGTHITTEQLDNLLNELTHPSRVEPALTELRNKGITNINFISPNSKFITMTIKLIKGDNANVKE